VYNLLHEFGYYDRILDSDVIKKAFKELGIFIELIKPEQKNSVEKKYL
jgi:hypothetical protein